MKKYIFIILFTFCFFFSFGHVNALEKYDLFQDTFDKDGSKVPALYTDNYYLNACNKYSSDYSYSCFEDYFGKPDDYNFKYILFKPQTGSYKYILMVQSDYAYSKTSATSTTTRYITNFSFSNNNYIYYRNYSSSVGYVLQFHNADVMKPGAFSYTAGLSLSDAKNNVVKNPDTFYSTGYANSLFTYLGYNSSTNSWEFINTGESLYYKSYTSSSTLDVITSSWDIYNYLQTDVVFSKNYVKPNLLPDYLVGYDKIDFNSRYKFMFISKSTSGYIYMSLLDYETYKPILNYYDVALLSQPFTSTLKWQLTNDGLYYRAYYDLSSYSGADFISLTKYANDFAGETNKIAYYVFVPTGSAVSMSLPVAKNDGNTIDYEWTDTDGVVHDGTVTNGDITNNNYGLNTAIDQLDKQFGFLFYPFELINNVLNRYQELSATSDFTIHIPDIKEPFYSQALISAQDFSFSTLYENTVFNYIHELIYLVTDVIIILKLCSLFLKKFNTIIGGESNV